MLENLHVKNLALIEETEIAFGRGLNILSGETGAGKSILLGALHLALGGKASRDMLREDGKEAFVEAVFSVKDPAQEQLLRQMDVEIYDGEVILSRRITESRSVARINGETVPAVKLQQVGSLLLDIYGQQEHQSLASKKKHMELLDDYGKAKIAPLKEAVKEAYRAWYEKKKELDQADMDDRERARELSFLTHEVEEITSAHLVAGEDEELERDYRRLSNGKRILEAVEQAYQQTGGMDGASDQIGRAIRSLSGLEAYDERLGDLQQTLSDIDNLLNDLNRELAEYRDGGEFDDESFALTERRLDEVNRLKDKYGQSVEQILEACREKEEKIQQLEDYDAYLEHLRQQVGTLERDLMEKCERLSRERQSCAKELSALVTQALLDLNFLDVAFEMRFERLESMTREGIDDAQFFISTNPGEPLKPLKNVASGGEMSRIMLAMKTVLAENDAIDTLIFDEIDAGISGRTAQAVSEKLSAVAGKHQVICITHLPQIAAMADCHFLIEKSVEHQSTVSHITRLGEEESVQELARMLGGTTITKAVMDNAREMKLLANNAKK